MTDRLRAAAEAALELAGDVVNGWESLAPLAVRRAAAESLDALRAALAEPESEQEPVAWRWLYDGKPVSERHFPMPSPDADIVARAAASKFPRTVQYLWAGPPRREWQGLTEAEIYPLYSEPSCDAEMLEFARAIEAKLKEKNG